MLVNESGLLVAPSVKPVPTVFTGIECWLSRPLFVESIKFHTGHFIIRVNTASLDIRCTCGQSLASREVRAAKGYSDEVQHHPFTDKQGQIRGLQARSEKTAEPGLDLHLPLTGELRLRNYVCPKLSGNLLWLPCRLTRRTI